MLGVGGGGVGGDGPGAERGDVGLFALAGGGEGGRVDGE